MSAQRVAAVRCCYGCGSLAPLSCQTPRPPSSNEPIDRCPEERIETLKALHHQEMAHSRHDDDLDTVAVHRRDVGGSVIGIYGNYWKVQLPQRSWHLAVEAHR